MSRIDRVGNDEVRRRTGIERELASKADQRVLRWFGHVERIDESESDEAGKRETEVRLHGWCEGGLGQQGNDS